MVRATCERLLAHYEKLSVDETVESEIREQAKANAKSLREHMESKYKIKPTKEEGVSDGKKSKG